MINLVHIYMTKKAHAYYICCHLIGELIFLNEATFLDNLKTRYYKDKIYVSCK